MSPAGEPVLAAGVVLFRRSATGPLFLLLENRRHKTWGFPKGHAEGGEDIEGCAARELTEECGPLAWDRVEGFHEVLRYRVDRCRREHGTEGYDKEVHYLLGETRDAEVHLSGEHSRAEWLDWDRARSRLGFAALRDLLDRARDRIEETGSPGRSSP